MTWHGGETMKRGEGPLPGSRNISYKLPPNWRAQHCGCAWYASFPVATICIYGVFPQIQFKITPSGNGSSIALQLSVLFNWWSAMKWKVKIPLGVGCVSKVEKHPFVLCALYSNARTQMGIHLRPPKPTQ